VDYPRVARTCSSSAEGGASDCGCTIEGQCGRMDARSQATSQLEDSKAVWQPPPILSVQARINANQVARFFWNCARGFLIRGCGGAR
jgi:hypothetical protein